MRKNSIRKLIHGILDLLPLFIIPIFALNIIHKEVEPISVTTSGYEYQSIYQTNEINTTDDLILGNVYHLDYAEIYSNDLDFAINIVSLYSYDIVDGDFYVDDLVFGTYNASRGNYVYLTVFDDFLTLAFSNESASIYYCCDFPFYIELTNFDFVVSYGLDSFKSWVSNEGFNVTSSDYNEIDYVYNEGVVYNDTDVGSQFIYTLYNATDKYFNMNNLFNMGSIYDWIQLNMFGGTAPLPIYIVWNIIVYEFFMDLIFLLYAVFMFIIDFSTNMIDGFLRRSKRGE